MADITVTPKSSAVASVTHNAKTWRMAVTRRARMALPDDPVAAEIRKGGRHG